MNSISQPPKNTSKGLNLMDLIELIIVPILGLYLIWRMYNSEKINPIEAVITLYLCWEFYKKLKKFLQNKQR